MYLTSNLKPYTGMDLNFSENIFMLQTTWEKLSSSNQALPFCQFGEDNITFHFYFKILFYFTSLTIFYIYIFIFMLREWNNVSIFLRKNVFSWVSFIAEFFFGEIIYFFWTFWEIIYSWVNEWCGTNSCSEQPKRGPTKTIQAICLGRSGRN